MWWKTIQDRQKYQSKDRKFISLNIYQLFPFYSLLSKLRQRQKKCPLIYPRSSHPLSLSLILDFQNPMPSESHQLMVGGSQATSYHMLATAASEASKSLYTLPL